MATEHICSCLLFFEVKLLAKIWDISHSSLQEQKKSDGVRRFSWDVYPKMSIRQVQIYFACALSNLPLKRKLCGCIQGPWLLFWNPFAAVWLHDRQGNSASDERQALFPRDTKQEAVCLLSVPSLLWPELCPRRNLPKWVFKQYNWNYIISLFRWKETICLISSLSRLPCAFWCLHEHLLR